MPNHKPQHHTITHDQVARTARLARLRLDQTQLHAIRHDLAAILDHAAQLDELSLDNVEPLSCPAHTNAPLHDDSPGPNLTTDQVLALAPRTDPPYIAVPKTINPNAGA